MKLFVSLLAVLLLATPTIYSSGDQEVEEDRVEEERIGTYGEAPELAELVRAGELPVVDERLPVDPEVRSGFEIGRYGGRIRSAFTGLGDIERPRDHTMYINMIRWDDPSGRAVPEVIEDYEVNEDASTYTIYLREGLRWSDGELHTADDWIWWRDNVLANETLDLQPDRNDWMVSGELGQFEKIDDHTLQISWSSPNPALWHRIAGRNWDRNGPTPPHYFEQFHPDFQDADELDAIVDERGYQDWIELFDDLVQGEINPERPVMGPWELAMTFDEAGDRSVYRRNPYFFMVDEEGQQLPYIDEWEWTAIGTAETISFNAMQGDLDYQKAHTLVRLEEMPVFQDNRERGDYWIQEVQMGHRQNAIVFNLTYDGDPGLTEVMNDVRFRQAMSLAMDREEIIDLVYFGLMDPMQFSPFPVNPPWASEELAFQYTEYDPDRANDLLDEMGLDQRNADGYRLRPDGEELRILIDTDGGRADVVEVVDMIADYWSEVGVRAQMNILESGFVIERMNSNEVIANVRQTGGEMPGLFSRPRYFVPIEGASAFASAYGRYWETGGSEGRQPAAGTDFRRAQDLLGEMLTTGDPDAQEAIWDEILQINIENMWTLGVSSIPSQYAVVKNGLRNVPEVREYPGSWGPRGITFAPAYYWAD